MHFDWESLTDSVHRCRLPFLDVTVGLVQGSTGTMLVDTGTTLIEAQAIRDDVREIAARDVTHVVLTHKHFDHVLGSGLFADAQKYCAPEVSDCITAATDQLRDDALSYGANAAEVYCAIAALRPPQHSVDEAVIDLGNREVIVARPGRGHTDADLVVLAAGVRGERSVVFTGDLLEESGDPAIDADSDVVDWPETLDRLLTIGGPDAIYVPGHGSVVGVDFIRRQQDWLRSNHPVR
ncbi:MBL fold metallo-hydrolase [Candidatus Mycobacterium wuenschmannii]|uniref:MBL fold metallo-hydrolase n=1 Tax=Candidatus Mycobacterium wuenschmannii TaxID=3027808 RepID=A0ABY8VRN4_9MYCO|nr:MBL fold metallo-hydrolase [Candidatus Mycobacterium wuenschmannii]WIM86298.1 MBL fold metallo-hydrolase [Candidatus Mycobacterium wuenschmannii]